MVSSEKKTAILMGCGSVLVVLGAVTAIFWPMMFYAVLKNMMILTETSQSFLLWRETPIPMYLECFMWNITNKDDILAGNATILKVEQIGPYVYKETHIKANITWNDNGTVTFYNQRWWHFVPEMSNGTLSDELVSINPVIATISYYMRRRSAFVNVPADILMRMYHSDMFLTANVSSWLFDGIDDPILDAVERFPEIIHIPYDKFGWFYDRNGSMEFDGVFVMDTGANDFSNLGNVMKWRNSDRTIYRDECGEVKGSTGELWAPEFGQQEVTIFAPDVCTYMTLHHNSTMVVEGVEGVLYGANDSMFDNGYKYPHLACYCDEVRDADCLPSGYLNVSSCRFGAPAFVTQPHMYNADPYYQSKIDGQHPQDSHQFRLALEMFTGIPLFVSAQLQINLLVRHVTGLSIANALPDADTVVPMFWFRQELEITPEYAALARTALTVRYAVPYVMHALTAIGGILLVIGIVILLKRILRSPDTAPILTQDDVMTE